MKILNSLTFIFLLLSATINAQEWQTVVDDTRLTTANGNSWHSMLSGDSYGNIHIVWEDDRDGNNEIYYTKLDNGGNTLIDDMRLTNDNAGSDFPFIKLDSSDNVHIIWRDSRNGSPEIYYIKLDNDGNVLVDSTRITYGSNTSSGHDLIIDSYDYLHIGWVDHRDGNAEIYYSKLDNNGNPIVGATRITMASGDSWWPYLDVDNDGNVQIAWYDTRNGNGELYYTKLDNNGNTLVDDTRLTFSGGAYGAPTLEVDNSNNIHIVWPDNRNGYGALYYTKLDKDGNTLIDDTLITISNGGGGYLADIDNEGNDHITWPDNRDGNDEIYYCKLDNDGSKIVEDTRLTFDNAESWHPRLYVDNNQSIHIIWDDNRDGNLEIYYKKGAIITDVDEESDIIPTKYSIKQNYPNPFNPVTTIEYTIPTSPYPTPYQGEGTRERFFVTLKVYDVLGNEIATLINEEKQPGTYSVQFDGAGLSSGVYFYTLTAGNFVESKKMTLMK